MILIFFDEFSASIGTATINNYPLEVTPRLADDGVDGALQPLSVVVVFITLTIKITGTSTGTRTHIGYKNEMLRKGEKPYLPRLGEMALHYFISCSSMLEMFNSWLRTSNRIVSADIASEIGPAFSNCPRLMFLF